MASYDSWAELEAALQQSMKRATSIANSRTIKAARYHIWSYYSGAKPRTYERTYQMANSFTTIPLENTGWEASFGYYLDDGYEYSPTSGLPAPWNSATDVFKAANAEIDPWSIGSFPYRGNRGMWNRAIKSTEQEVFNAYASYFTPE